MDEQEVPGYLWDIPTEDLVMELDSRFDVFFMAGMLADPGPEDDGLNYWLSSPEMASAQLAEYAIHHRGMNKLRAAIMRRKGL